MLKVGIIGTGVIAREHAEAVAALPGSFNLVAVADEISGRAKAFADSIAGVRCLASACELISDAGVDLVTIATPPSSHENLAIAALDSGKYVLCEKPLAHCLSSAQGIVAAEARHPGRLSVNYQLRYASQYRRMVWLIRNGWIGELQSAIVERHGFLPSSVATSAQWWGAWDSAGGGVLMTQMIHELDILLDIMGEPLAVDARMDTRFSSIQSEDWIEGQVKFGGKRSVAFAASVNSGQMRGVMTFTGSKGTISPVKLMLEDTGTMEKAIAAVDEALPDTRAASYSFSARVMRKIGHRFGAPAKVELQPHALLYREIAFAASIESPLPIPPAEAIGSLNLCAGAYAAAICGQEVKLPLTMTDRTWSGITPEMYAARSKPQILAQRVPQLPKSSTVRIGLIGLDTTHATTFADLLHNPYASDHIPGARIVAAFPGGSGDMPISSSRVGGFVAELRDSYGVPILDSPEAVADAADVVFILSADGRTHPGLFRSVAGRGKPVFIDKPFAVSTTDAERILAIARTTGTKVLGSSAYRYADALVAAIRSIREGGETIRSCKIRYWGQIQPTQGRFYWYGIHGAEMLLTVMGKGVQSVSARTVGAEDIIEVTFTDGRHCCLVGHHNDSTFHVSIQTNNRTWEVPVGGAVSARLLAAVLDRLTPGGYPRLWRASPLSSVEGRFGRIVDPDEAETLEVVKLLDAAQRSHVSGEIVEFKNLGSTPCLLPQK